MSSFLSLPAELRNHIYDLLFTESCPYTCAIDDLSSFRRTVADFGKPTNLDGIARTKPQPLLLTCRQIHTETQLLHLQRTNFAIGGIYAGPEPFSRLCNAALSPPLMAHVRHITLVGRINRLRVMNES